MADYTRTWREWQNFAGFFCDFLDGLTGSPLSGTVSGAGAGVASVAGTTTEHGVLSHGTGTTAAGYIGASTDAQATRLGGGLAVFEAKVRFPTLSTAGERYVARIGFLDVIGADAVDGAYFEYDEASSANWRAKTASNSVRTTTTSGVAVPANTWVSLRIAVAAGGASVLFYIDGVLVATHAANIPTGAGRETGVGYFIQKTAGTTSRALETDYVGAHIERTATPT